MRTVQLACAGVCLFLSACGPSAKQQEDQAVQQPARAEPPGDRAIAVERLRRTVVNLESYLADLEGKLRNTQAESWTQDASAAQHILGNIRIEIDALKRGLNDAAQK